MMQVEHRGFISLALTLAAVLLVAGCMSPSPAVQYYTLTPLSMDEQGPDWESDGVLAVGPVSLPEGPGSQRFFLYR